MAGPAHRITDGWIVFVSTDQLKVIDAAGGSWTVQTPGYEESRVAALLDGAPCETEAELQLLGAIEEIGAVRAVRAPELDAQTFEMLVATHVPQATREVIRANGFEPKDAVTSLAASTFAVFAESWFDELILTANRFAIETGSRVVPVVTSGPVAFVGPLVDPATGGPCLRCLHERVSATLIASNKWAMSTGSPLARVGSVAPMASTLQFAMTLAHDFLMEITTTEPVDDRYRTVRRFDLRDATAERLTCHPAPWCPDCGHSSDESRPFTEYPEHGPVAGD